MAYEENTIIIYGRLTRDPEAKGTQQTNIARFSIANQRGKKDEEKTFGFYDVTCFNKTADAVMQYCKKGSAVLIKGALHWSQFEDKEGRKRTSISITAASVQFLSSVGSAQEQSSDTPPF
jgi:single-strand DNA-binding protein